MDNNMDWIEDKIYRDLLYRERIPQHGQARRPQLLSTRQKLAWLMLGLVSGALIVIGAWWSAVSELGGGAGGKGWVSDLPEHRQSGELPAQSFTTEETGGGLKHGLISRLEALPPPAGGIGNDSASAGKAEDTASYSNAQFNLGVMYATGDGVPKNASKAAEWFKKAAEQGDASAQFKLGVMYRIGEGVPKNATKAAEWFRKAAAQGDADAQFYLAVMYSTGEGVSKD